MVEDPSSITLAVSNADHVWANFHFLSFIIIILFYNAMYSSSTSLEIVLHRRALLFSLLRKKKKGKRTERLATAQDNCRVMGVGLKFFWI